MLDFPRILHTHDLGSDNRDLPAVTAVRMGHAHGRDCSVSLHISSTLTSKDRVLPAIERFPSNVTAQSMMPIMVKLITPFSLPPCTRILT